MGPKTDWKKLQLAAGPATRVPQQIKKLLSDDEDERLTAYGALVDTLWAPKAWFSASAPVAHLLLDAAAGASEFRFFALWLLADVLTGGHERLLAAGFRLDEAELAARKETHAAVLERSDVLLDGLASGDARVRAAAALVLAFLPERAAKTIAALKARLSSSESDPLDTANASFLLCLAALERQGAVEDPAGLRVECAKSLPAAKARARGAAAIARAMAQSAFDAKPVARALAEGFLAPPAPFPWCGGPFDRVVTAVARGRGASGEWNVVESMMDLLRDDGIESVARDAASSVLLQLGGFKERWAEEDIALAADLSKKQRSIAEVLAGRNGLRGVGWGVPGSARDRRRWLGLAPGGPLEKPNPLAFADVPRDWPLWRSWRALYERQVTDELGPASVRDSLGAADLLVAMGEVSLGAYGILRANGQGAFSFEDIAKAVERAGAAAVPWAVGFANELAEVFAEKRSPEAAGEVAPGPELSTIVLLPIVRSGRDIGPRWDCLVPWAGPYARDLLSALPPVRREARLFGLLSTWWGDPDDPLGLPQLIPVLDLVPSRRIVALLLRKLGACSPDEARAYRDRIEKLAETEPGVREALAKAGA